MDIYIIYIHILSVLESCLAKLAPPFLISLAPPLWVTHRREFCWCGFDLIGLGFNFSSSGLGFKSLHKEFSGLGLKFIIRHIRLSVSGEKIVIIGHEIVDFAIIGLQSLTSLK